MMTKLELTDQELQALTSLMDLGVKAGGLQAVTAAAHLLAKLEVAVKAAKEAEVKPDINLVNLPEKEAI
jgi:hypothetical protein